MKPETIAAIRESPVVRVLSQWGPYTPRRGESMTGLSCLWPYPYRWHRWARWRNR